MWITLVIILPTIVLIVPKTLAQFAGQVGWLSVLIAGFSMGLIHYIFLRLSFGFSQQGIIADCKSLFGPLRGRLIVLPYLLMVLDAASVILFEAVEFMRVIMPKTPMIVFWILIALLTTYLSYKGVEVLARVIETVAILILPLFLAVLLVIVINGLNIIELERLKPVVFDIKMIKGSIIPAHWFILVPTILVVLKPYFQDNNQVLKFSLVGSFVSQLIVIILFIITIAVFGVGVTGALNFPFYFLTRLSIRGFEVIVFVMWLFGNILKVALYYFTATKLVANYFAIKDYKLLIIPMAVLLTVFSIFKGQSSLLDLTVRYTAVRNLLVVYMPTLAVLSIGYLLNNEA